MYGMAHRHSQSPEQPPHSAQSAFTLIELLTVIAIIAIVMGMVVGAGRFGRHKAIEGKARAGLEHIANALNEYNLKNGVYPGSLVSIADDLPQGVCAFDVSKRPLDPWGRIYQYETGQLNRSFRLWSTGRNDELSDPDRAADDIHLGK